MGKHETRLKVTAGKKPANYPEIRPYRQQSCSPQPPNRSYYIGSTIDRGIKTAFQILDESWNDLFLITGLPASSN